MNKTPRNTPFLFLTKKDNHSYIGVKVYHETKNLFQISNNHNMAFDKAARFLANFIIENKITKIKFTCAKSLEKPEKYGLPNINPYQEIITRINDIFQE